MDADYHQVVIFFNRISAIGKKELEKQKKDNKTGGQKIKHPEKKQLNIIDTKNDLPLNARAPFPSTSLYGYRQTAASGVLAGTIRTGIAIDH